LVLKFEQVDTEELRHIEIAVEGDRAIYKIGEGETAHYHIPNDKKLWETQFMIAPSMESSISEIWDLSIPPG
jgi:hypothetical protein